MNINHGMIWKQSKYFHLLRQGKNLSVTSLNLEKSILLIFPLFLKTGKGLDFPVYYNYLLLYLDFEVLRSSSSMV